MSDVTDRVAPIADDATTCLAMTGVERIYRQAGAPLPVLRGIDFNLHPGELVALIGPSGSGKSTLLHLAGLLERPDRGSVVIAGRDCGRMGDGERTALRRSTIGFVYQFHHLLPEFSALENVVLPQMIAGVARRAAKARATELLTLVGLAERLDHRPARLSGGEQQRVAIVRALANRPRILLGDEPTGNLDQHTADDVLAVLIDVVRRSGVAALIATHNIDLARRMDRIVALQDGYVIARDGI